MRGLSSYPRTRARPATMMPVYLVRVPFLIPNWAAAQVLLPRTIFLKQGVPLTVELIAHELEHVDQIERMGLFRYWWSYLRTIKQTGYDDHPMEEGPRRLELWELDRAQAYLNEWDAFRDEKDDS